MSPRPNPEVELAELQQKVASVEEILKGGGRRPGLIERVETLEREELKSTVKSAVISGLVSAFAAVVVFFVTVMPALAELRKAVAK